MTDTDQYGQMTPEAAVALILPQVTISPEQPHGALTVNDELLDAIRRLVAFTTDDDTQRGRVVLDLIRQGWPLLADDIAEGLSTDQALRRLRDIGEDEDSDVYLTVSAAALPAVKIGA